MAIALTEKSNRSILCQGFNPWGSIMKHLISRINDLGETSKYSAISL